MCKGSCTLYVHLTRPHISFIASWLASEMSEDRDGSVPIDSGANADAWISQRLVTGDSYPL